MNIFLEIHSLDNIRTSVNDLEYVVGLDGVSLRAPVLFSLDELDEIINKAKSLGQKIAINLCKMFHEDDLALLKDTLKSLKTKEIDHIFFGDLAVYMMAKELKMEDKLIYQALPYLTSTKDVNEYLDFARSVVVSPDLTLKEQVEIINEAKKPSIIFAFGKYAIFHSRRRLLSNYFKYRSLDYLTSKNNKDFTIVEEFRSDHYPITEDEDGTHVFLPRYYCLLEELSFFNNPFGIYLSTNFLSNELVNILAKTYDEVLSNPDKAKRLFENLKETIPDLGEGIRNQKTFLLKGDAR